MALSFLKKGDKNPKEKKVISVRIQKLSTEDLIKWVDVMLMETGRAFDAWRYKNGPIDEVQTSVDVMSEVLAELDSRMSTH